MNFFLAKQPVFDRKQQVFGYEILHNTCGDQGSSIDEDEATLEVINTILLVVGLESLTRGKKAFIPFSKALLENQAALLLPGESVILEVNGEDPGILDSCRKLKEQGYTLALNSCSCGEELLPFLEVCRIVKTSYLQRDGREMEAVLKSNPGYDVMFWAENVDSRQDLARALEGGYSLFQGSVFSKPQIISGRDMVSFKPTYMLLLQEAFLPEIDFDRVEKLIKQDVSLSYKLLKYINSLQFGFRAEIRSIKQALVILGRKGLVQWISLVSIKSLSSNKPEELFFSAIYRAKFCELIALNTRLKDQSSDLFLMGMFSLIDAILDQPLEEILKDLPLCREVKEALTGENNDFNRVFQLIRNYEQGSWDQVAAGALHFNLKENQLVYFYLDSLKYANTVHLAQSH